MVKFSPWGSSPVRQLDDTGGPVKPPVHRATLSTLVLPAAVFLTVRGIGMVMWWWTSTTTHRPINLHAWDGDWYLAIAQHGYQNAPGTDLYGHHHAFMATVFFPGYPLTIRALAPLLAHSYLATGLTVSVLAGVALAAAVARLTARYTTHPWAPVIAVVLVAAAPASDVYSMTYPEALTCGLAAWALVGVIEHRWWLVTPCTIAAGVCSPMAMPLIAAVTITAMVTVYQHPTPHWSAGVAAMLAPLGTIAYLLWVPTVTGSSYFMWQHQGWGTTFDGGIDTTHWVYSVLSTDSDTWMTASVLVLLGTLAGVGCSARRMWWPITVYTTLVLILVIGTGGPTVYDKPRLLLVIFPLAIPAAEWITRRRTTTAVALTTLIAAAGLWYSAYSLTAWKYSI